MDRKIISALMRIITFLMLCVADLSYSQFSLQPFNLDVQQVTDICNAGDERLFIAQQNGEIRICDLNGTLFAVPFLDISSKVISGGERGLLGMAFSPDFKDDRLFYVNYTGLDGDNRISRFTVSNDPDMADPASEEILFIIDQPFSNHNGGGMKFGPDGFLYIGSGDGGAAGDPQNNGQDPFSKLGKILRLDVGAGLGYLIPSDNPFHDGINGDPLVWSLGLRNPWRISFDLTTGELWIGDVGQNKWEEIDRELVFEGGGLNYGWKCYEANAVYDTTGCKNVLAYEPPYYAYDHSGGNCSVTGGSVYRGALHSTWYGRYFYTDYCTGVIHSIADSGNMVSEIVHGSFSPFSYSTFGEDVFGELYIGKTGTGVFKLTDASDCAPVAHISDEDTLQLCGPMFTLSTPFHPDLTYSWYRNDTLLQNSASDELNADIGGHYKVMVTDINGCTTISDKVFVSFSAAPSVAINLSNTNFCIDSSPFPVPVSFEGGVFEGSGMNNGVFVPLIAGAGAHTVTYTYIDNTGCRQEVSKIFRVDSCMSGVLDPGSWFEILQNPVVDELQLILERPVRDGTQVMIYDMSGRLVYSEQLNELGSRSMIGLDLTTLADGLFLVIVGTNSEFQSSKFQKVSY